MPVDLPPKKEVATALLQQSTVFIHLDPRAEDVIVPPWFKKQPRLVLQVGLNMAVPIPDLHLDDEAVSCTLSFNRSPCFCRIPWKAVFALISEDRRGMVWPDDVPREVAVQVQGPARQELDRARAAKRAHLRAVPAGPTADAPTEPAPPSPSADAGDQATRVGVGEPAQQASRAELAAQQPTAGTRANRQRAGAKKKTAKKVSTAAAKKPAKKPAAAKKKPAAAKKKPAAAKKKPAAAKQKPVAAKKKATKAPAAAKLASPKAQRTSASKKKAPPRALEAAPTPGGSKQAKPRKEPARPAPSRSDASGSEGKPTKRKLPPYLRVVK